MAGINRLGKAPPRPGSLRPPDPNKYKTENMYSLGGENDAEYLRMVQDIEDTQSNHTGWLFGRGAFDKGDLLYMRDEDEKRRFMEQQLRDSERSQFRKLQAADSLPSREAPSEPLPRPKDKSLSKAKPPPTFTMVSKSEKPQDTAPRIPRPSAAPVVQPAKKPRLSPVQAVKQSGSNPAVQQCQPHNKARPPDPVEQKQPPASAAAQPGEEPAADLAGLLGGYASDDSS